MSVRLSINNEILSWAIDRAGLALPAFSHDFPHLELWLKGERKPTVKQLQEFARKVHLPFGYLMLSAPPKEELPIPYFRTLDQESRHLSLNVYDSILMLQQRQEWLREYLKMNEYDSLPFVGRFRNQHDITEVVNDIRDELGLDENWASKFPSWQAALDHLVQTIENKGIIVSFNGVVGNNTHRNIPVEECRGFVLVDEWVPFMFINNSDFKAAQMFTVAHELAHIWKGSSAVFDFRNFQAADVPSEKECDQIAAEFLVSEKALDRAWSVTTDIQKLARLFKVSEIVIARRALDTGKWTKKRFFGFYQEYSTREFLKKENQSPGGDFFNTAKKRISITFASHIHQALQSGQLLYRDACKLTDLKGDSFQKFISKAF